MKKISKLLEYFGLVNGEDKQETDETMETQQQDEGKVVPMFGSGSAGTWRDKSSDREYDKYDRPYEKTYENLTTKCSTRTTTARRTLPGRKRLPAGPGTRCCPCR